MEDSWVRQSEFSTYGIVLDKVKKKLDEASLTLEKDVGVRSRAINRALKNVECTARA